VAARQHAALSAWRGVRSASDRMGSTACVHALTAIATSVSSRPCNVRQLRKRAKSETLSRHAAIAGSPPSRCNSNRYTQWLMRLTGRGAQPGIRRPPCHCAGLSVGGERHHSTPQHRTISHVTDRARVHPVPPAAHSLVRPWPYGQNVESPCCGTRAGHIIPTNARQLAQMGMRTQSIACREIPTVP